MNKKKEIAVDIISALFVLLFLYAALTKLMDYQKFVVQLGQSPMLTPIAEFMAWLVPAVEIVIAALLMIPRTRYLGLCASTWLMAAFSTYIVIITQYAFYVPCSCGGILNSLGWTEHFIFNLVFVALGIAGIILHQSPVKSNDNAALA